MHIIRLRGPWQVEPVARFVAQPDGTYVVTSDDLPVAARMTMPADWTAVCGGDFLGRVRYRRTFQKPTGLETGERVFLVVEPARSLGVVELNRPLAVSSGPSNGKRLGEVGRGAEPFRTEITEMLENHNRLEIVVEHPVLDAANEADDDVVTRLPGGLVGEVRLEIEEMK